METLPDILRIIAILVCYTSYRVVIDKRTDERDYTAYLKKPRNLFIHGSAGHRKQNQPPDIPVFSFMFKPFYRSSSSVRQSFSEISYTNATSSFNPKRFFPVNMFFRVILN